MNNNKNFFGNTNPSARRQVNKKSNRSHETVPALDSRIAQCRMQPMTRIPGDRAANAFFGEPGCWTRTPPPSPCARLSSFSGGVLRGSKYLA